MRIEDSHADCGRRSSLATSDSAVATFIIAVRTSSAQDKLALPIRIAQIAFEMSPVGNGPVQPDKWSLQCMNPEPMHAIGSSREPAASRRFSESKSNVALRR